MAALPERPARDGGATSRAGRCAGHSTRAGVSARQEPGYRSQVAAKPGRGARPASTGAYSTGPIYERVDALPAGWERADWKPTCKIQNTLPYSITTRQEPARAFAYRLNTTFSPKY